MTLRSAFFLLAGLSSLPVFAQTSPLHGRFYVGEKYRTDGSGVTRLYGQMYVEFQKPQKLKFPYPIVMVHGAGGTGVVYTGTPDGREGWSDWFLEQGYTTYVVDQPGRGRSAYNPEYGEIRYRTQNTQKARAAQTWPQDHLHTQGVLSAADSHPGNPVYDEMMAEAAPDIPDIRLQQELTRDALVALLDRIGPAIVLTHSQSGPMGWLVADARPNLVKAVVALEPGASTAVGPAPMLKDDPQKWFIAELPLKFEPAITDPAELNLVAEGAPEGPDLIRCRRMSPPFHRLVNLEHTPVLLINGEASYHAIREHCTAHFLQDAGVPVDFVPLQDVGIHGNSHPMMIEKNNLEVAAFISKWLQAHVH